ncbi:tyrosine-type recombinase/integrase [Microvirga tunisiensis]|uniref:Tyrosine-type recombinase/integrase n=1 Tax=Microvirga tunisiensis TaxID=2108360 RepID=A0A5N7MT04_9HYPH|nr:tyrosine-type recombinase/integrase [Microvirga tunisiensis]MPR12179.1 tyrosine-type recombinase/integrase [Microvirga tunisiensis]MPR30125.1 tyrosine-type recombinase/integrase [Microvirga tunisiensis]
MLNLDLARYAELQHHLGFRFRIQHTLRKSFVAFAEGSGDQYVQTARVLAWATLAPSPQQRRNRLLTVRRFALALSAEDRHHEIPPADALGRRLFERRIPHIYTADEITALMRAAALLKPSGSIRPLLYETLFGLLAATGMRVSEALALSLDDLTADGLVIRQTKFQKSRLLPLHATTWEALDRYVSARQRLGTLNDALFVSTTGTPPSYPTVIAIFLRLARSTGLRGQPGQPGPRIHDLRHTFAVRSLEQCRPDRDAVGRHIVALSTYLGHAHVTDTYWYLQATPILMGQIASAGEALHQGAVA